MIKPETVTIIVYPSGVDADTLTVADAMQQVLDLFALLGKAEAQKTGVRQVVWRLERATTNTPLTVSAVAVSTDPAGSVDQEAHLAKATLEEGLSGLLHARERAPWIDAEGEAIALRILRRNLNGVGRTDIRFDDATPPVVIDHRAALRAVNYLEMKAAEAAAQIDDLTRTEHGAVEGNVVGIAPHYNKPAFVLRSRAYGRDVKCVLSPPIADRIGAEHAWKEAWGGGQRVLVSGRLHYNSNGDLMRVDVDEITPIAPADVNLRDIQRAPTDSVSAREYLDRLWGEPDA